MISDKARAEMIFYATTGDYSDAERYERFALECKLDEKAVEIGTYVAYLAYQIPIAKGPLEILETASATGLTAAGVTSVLTRIGIDHVYTSLDIERNLLDFAKQREMGDRFVRGDFENLPFADGTFDIYIMMGAEGYRSSGRFYPEVYRVLKSGGYYIMPQIGPEPVVNPAEIDTASRSGLLIVEADNYLIAKKR